jgi:hypothetical protein
MVTTILDFAKAINSDTGEFDTSVDVRENVSASTYYQRSNSGNPDTARSGASATSTKTTLNLYSSSDDPNASLYNIDTIRANSPESNSFFTWNNGAPRITVNGQTRQFLSENTWKKTRTAARTNSNLTWDVSDYITWTQDKSTSSDTFKPPYYVREDVFNSNQAFYQGGAGISKFTSDGVAGKEGKVASKDDYVVHRRPGKLTITYRLLKGTANTVHPKVTIHVRDCEAFTRGLYTPTLMGENGRGKIYQDKQ